MPLIDFFKRAVKRIDDRLESVVNFFFSDNPSSSTNPTPKTFFELNYFDKPLWEGFFNEELTELQEELASNKISVGNLSKKLLELEGLIGKQTLSPFVYQQALKELKLFSTSKLIASGKYCDCINEVFVDFIVNFKSEPTFIVECLEGEFIQIRHQVESSGLSYEDIESFLEVLQFYRDYVPAIIYQHAVKSYKTLLENAAEKGKCSEEAVEFAYGLINEAQCATEKPNALNKSLMDWIESAIKQERSVSTQEAKDDKTSMHKNGLLTTCQQVLMYAVKHPLQMGALLLLTQTTATAAFSPLIQRQSKRAAVSANIYDLANLNSTIGFRIDGAVARDFSGNSVSTAGDFNNDGLSDIVIGAYGASSAGSSYVIYGKNGGYVATIDLAALTATQGFSVAGAVAGDLLGDSVSEAGDVNGDGLPDIVIGASSASPNGRIKAGSSYVIYGKNGGYVTAINLAGLTTTQGFSIDGATAGDLSGSSVRMAGDVNGDGLVDIVVGAYAASPKNRTYAGSSYVIYGKNGGYVATMDLAGLTTTQGFSIDGATAGDQSGIAVSTAGDVNGDGLADVVIGAEGASLNGRTNAGCSYVIYGKNGGYTSAIDLTALTPIQGFLIDGAVANDWSGSSVSTAGDVNGDGLADLAIGALNASPDGRGSAGSSYVIYGKKGGYAAAIDLAALTLIQGFRIDGAAAGDYSGWSVSTAGDVNGDGLQDIVIGAPDAAPNGKGAAGSSYVIYGNREGYTAIDLFSLTVAQGFRIDGAVAGDNSGDSVNTAGDVNGDGLPDIVIGAYNASPNGRTQAGSSYVIYGSYTPCDLINNTLTIAERDNVTLSSSNLIAVDNFYNSSDSQIQFTVTNLVGGYFELISTGQSVTTFSQQQIKNGAVRFMQDAPESPAYDVSVANIKTVSVPQPAAITYIDLHNFPIQVLGVLSNISAQVATSIEVSINGYNYFKDPDNQPLTFTIQSVDGSALPSWIMYSAEGNTTLRLYSDPLPSTLAGTSTALSFIATKISIPMNISNYTNFNVKVAAASGSKKNLTGVIVGSVAGGVVGIAALAGGVFGIWRYRKAKQYAETRKQHLLADRLRSALKLNGVENFESEKGLMYLNAVQIISDELAKLGMNVQGMYDEDLKQLSVHLATAIKSLVPVHAIYMGFANEIDPLEIQANALSIAKVTKEIASRHGIREPNAGGIAMEQLRVPLLVDGKTEFASSHTRGNVSAYMSTRAKQF